MNKANIDEAEVRILDIDGIYDVGLRSIGFNLKN